MDSDVVWRFVAARDVPEHGIVRGDIVTAQPGGPTRLLRRLPVNPGLLLFLACDDALLAMDGVVGTEKPIIDAMASVDTATHEATGGTQELRLVR
jgi:hypothetical protein